MSVDEKISFPVGEAAQIIASELPDFPEPAGFARAWFPRQIDAGGVLVGEPRLAASHARLGAVRAPGEDLIASFTPREATDGWGVRGSTILQVVTDDRPFLVDTATLVLTEAGWTVRGLHHPILSVTRDAAGRLSGVGAGRAASRALRDGVAATLCSTAPSSDAARARKASSVSIACTAVGSAG